MVRAPGVRRSPPRSRASTRARELHRKAAEADALAARSRAERDRLMLQHRAEDPRRWSYSALARAVGCSRELVASSCGGGAEATPGALSIRRGDPVACAGAGRETAEVKIVVLTGAGISAESGVPTFRDADGLWEGHDPMAVATPEAFAADPDLVHRFYDERRAALPRVQPNAAHRALARLEEALGHDLHLVTQNVDDLHERAGSRRVHHMHGRLRAAWCTACDSRHDWDAPLLDRPACPTCGSRSLRPDVVWFGEVPYDMDVVEERLWDCGLFVAIGTSGLVYPAAAFVHWARGDTLELNLDPSAGSTDFARSRQGPATELVPAWVDELLGQVG